METYRLPYVKQPASGNLLCDPGSSTLVLCDSLERWDGVGGGREVQKGGDIWLTHADVWQKPTQHCKAIILQVKEKQNSAHRFSSFPHVQEDSFCSKDSGCKDTHILPCRKHTCRKGHFHSLRLFTLATRNGKQCSGFFPPASSVKRQVSQQ